MPVRGSHINIFDILHFGLSYCTDWSLSKVRLQVIRDAYAPVRNTREPGRLKRFSGLPQPDIAEAAFHCARRYGETKLFHATDIKHYLAWSVPAEYYLIEDDIAVCLDGCNRILVTTAVVITRTYDETDFLKLASHIKYGIRLSGRFIDYRTLGL